MSVFKLNHIKILNYLSLKNASAFIPSASDQHGTNKCFGNYAAKLKAKG